MSTVLARAASVISIAVFVSPAAFGQLRFWARPADRDVASVHVAVQSIAPFEDYIAALQPTFKMTADDALKTAIAQTRLESTETLQASIFELSAALRGGGVAAPSDEKPLAAAAPAAVSRTITPTLADGTPQTDAIVLHNAATALMQYVAHLNTYVRDAAITTRTRPYIVRMQVAVLPTTSTRAYDTYSTISFFTEPGPASGRLAASPFARDSATRAADGGVQIEAMKYEVAADKIALDEARAAYDRDKSPEHFKKAADTAADLARHKRLQQLVTQQQENDLNAAACLRQAMNTVCGSVPLRVIPLLVTDNFEASLHTDTFEQIRNIALAAASSGVGSRIAAGLRRQLDDAEKTLARNLNGVMTATQVADNSIQVRLGAMYGNRSDAMVPRTYGITLLVLFPTAEQLLPGLSADSAAGEIIPCGTARFTADAFFRDSASGRLVRRTNDQEMTDALQRVAPEMPWRKVRELVEYVRSDDFAGFSGLFKDQPLAATELWSRAVGTMSQYSLSRGRFQALFRDTKFFGSESYGSLIDDGTKSQLTLSGGANLLPDRIAGTIRVQLKAPASEPLFVNATAIDVTTDGRMATLTFPSLHKLVKKDNVVKVHAVVRYVTGVRDWQTAHQQLQRDWLISSTGPESELAADQNAVVERSWFPVRKGDVAIPIAYVGPLDDDKKDSGKPKAAFTMKAGVSNIFAVKNAGALTIALKRDEPGATFPMFFSVDKGGEISSVQPTVVATRGDRNTATEGEYRLNLENLTVGSTVVVKSWRIDEADGKTPIPGDTVTVEIREQQEGNERWHR